MHAGWNVLSKSRHPSTSFFLISTLAGAVLLAPVLAWHHRALGDVPPRVWLLLAGTGFFMAMYYMSLAGAYRAGDMSVAYPLARSSPLIVVSVVALLLGRGHQITGWCLTGIGLVVAGCFLLPMRRVGEFRPGHYLNASCGLALLAAVGTAGYTILDDEALRLLRNDAGLGMSALSATLFYAALETVSCALWQALGVWLSRTGWADWRRECRAHGRHAVAAGAAIWAGYGLVLLSLAFVANVSYVAAFRQLSIPLGAAFGIAVLKEPAHPPKIAGVAVIFAGLLLVAAG